MKTYQFQQALRWFGPTDPVPLAHIAQSGATHVVSALHHIANGEVWPVEQIRSHQQAVREHNLEWSVVESVPVHDDIKRRADNYKIYIQNYKETLRNLAHCGIHTVTYNFMPVLDWTRTDLAWQLPNGARALRFDWLDYVAFDLYILGREARHEYPEPLQHQAQARYASYSRHQREQLQHNLLAGLPGSEEAHSLEGFLSILQKYRNISANALRQNLIDFLTDVLPTCEEAGIKLAIHPDDPPFSLFGLPRVVSTARDLEQIFAAAPSPNNGLCFCTGSFGVRPDNDVPAMVKQFGNRIHFVHLRNTTRQPDGSFYEANHLEGDTPMAEVVGNLVDTMQERQVSLPMRPDHGHQMLDDLNKTTNPGYSAIGRLKGLAELRGLELGIAFAKGLSHTNSSQPFKI